MGLTINEKNNRFLQLQGQITDIETQIEQDNIKVIPLGVNKKYPTDKDYYQKEYPISKLMTNRGNIGICVGYNHQTNGKSIAVIDIDGYTCTGVDEETKNAVKKETADYLFECLKNIPECMIVETQSGGHHIYLWNETVVDEIHETSKNLHFPDDFHIEHLQGKSLDHSIEIFTKWESKQCVLPASTINRKDGTIGEYKVISNINRFEDIGTVKNIHNTVQETLEQYGFKYYQEKKQINYNDQANQYGSTEELKTLNRKEVKELVEHLTPYFQVLDNVKHDSYLSLGGYLYRNVTKESCKLIVEGLLKSTKDNYPKHITTALKNYERTNTNKKGLPHLIENIQSKGLLETKDKTDRFKFLLYKYTKPHHKHYILTNRPEQNKKTYIILDYNGYEISTFTETSYKDDNGDWQIKYSNSHTIMNMCPLDIYESYNILDKKAGSKLCFTYYRKGMPYKQTIEGNDIESVEKQLKKRAGIVLKPREYQGILNEIIKEYIRLDLLHIIEDIPVPGIFINPITNELARADKDGSIPIKYPSKEKVLEALKVWETLYEIYPGNKTKLSHILRFGLLCPFSFIFKTRYHWMPILFLYGASHTAKTTLSEICLSPYTDIDDDVSVVGDSLGTPYTMGNGLSRQGYGIIINEPKKIIDNDNMVEIVKRAVETQYCREKQLETGVHGKIPAYSNMIFTSNIYIPTQDAFIRRCNFIEFTKSERLSEEDERLFAERLNHVNWNDTDFLKLRSIGDFIVAYVHDNMELFKFEHNTFLNKILDALFKYVEVKPSEWLYYNTELMDISESDNEIVNNFKRMVLKDYNRLTSNPHKLFEKASTINEIHPPDRDSEVMLDSIVNDEVEVEARFKQLFITCVKNGHIEYLHYQQLQNGKEYVIVNSLVKDALKDFNNVTVTCKGLADFMDCEYKKYKFKDNSIWSFRMEYDRFRRFLIS